MKKYFFTLILASIAALTKAQDSNSNTFKGYFYNDEYNVFLNIDFYSMEVEVPNHSLYGNLPGYLGKKLNNFYWVITSAKIKDKRKAELSLINDYGSEDLKASLRKENDSIYIFKQENGSPLKVPNNGKWLKLPKEFKLKKRIANN